MSILRGFLSNEKIEGVKGLSLTANGMGVVFDVPADDVNAFTAGMLNVPFRNYLFSVLLVLLNHWNELKNEICLSLCSIFLFVPIYELLGYWFFLSKFVADCQKNQSYHIHYSSKVAKNYVV